MKLTSEERKGLKTTRIQNITKTYKSKTISSRMKPIFSRSKTSKIMMTESRKASKAPTRNKNLLYRSRRNFSSFSRNDFFRCFQEKYFKLGHLLSHSLHQTSNSCILLHSSLINVHVSEEKRSFIHISFFLNQSNEK